MEVATAFDVASLLLVFVTLLFGLRYPVLVNALSEPARAGSYERENQKTNLKAIRSAQGIPLLLLASFATWLFLPLSLEIVQKSRPALWNFDVARTGLVAMTALMASLAVWSGILVLRLTKRVGELARK